MYNQELCIIPDIFRKCVLCFDIPGIMNVPIVFSWGNWLNRRTQLLFNDYSVISEIYNHLWIGRS